MTILHVDIPEELNKRFRVVIINRYGTKKGALQQAVTEALKLWLKEG